LLLAVPSSFVARASKALWFVEGEGMNMAG
jgi:hypothetical protein